MTDLSELTHEELRDYFRAGFVELETRTAGHNRMTRLAKIAHRALDELDDSAVSTGQVQARSGGNGEGKEP